jgi:hypothetical protein
MATLSVQLTQVSSIVAEGFQVVNTITSATNMVDDKVFLFRQEDDGFETVCTNYAYITYPTTSSSSFEFYRKNAATIVYPAASTGAKGSQDVRDRVTLLVDSLQDAQDTFVGTVVTDIP